MYWCNGTTEKQKIMCLKIRLCGHFRVATQNWSQPEKENSSLGWYMLVMYLNVCVCVSKCVCVLFYPTKTKFSCSLQAPPPLTMKGEKNTPSFFVFISTENLFNFSHHKGPQIHHNILLSVISSSHKFSLQVCIETEQISSFIIENVHTHNYFFHSSLLRIHKT